MRAPPARLDAAPRAPAPMPPRRRDRHARARRRRRPRSACTQCRWAACVARASIRRRRDAVVVLDLRACANIVVAVPPRAGHLKPLALGRSPPTAAATTARTLPPTFVFISLASSRRRRARKFACGPRARARGASERLRVEWALDHVPDDLACATRGGRAPSRDGERASRRRTTSAAERAPSSAHSL